MENLAIISALKVFTAFRMRDKSVNQLTKEYKIDVQGDAKLKKSTNERLCSIAFAGVKTNSSI